MNPTIIERLKAAATFVLAWLSTPSSLVGITAILTALVGNEAKWVEGVAYALMLGAGALLVAYPQRKK